LSDERNPRSQKVATISTSSMSHASSKVAQSKPPKPGIRRRAGNHPPIGEGIQELRDRVAYRRTQPLHMKAQQQSQSEKPEECLEQK
jgi:hypothetical protein